MKLKAISFILAIVIILSLLPLAALSEEDAFTVEIINTELGVVRGDTFNLLVSVTSVNPGISLTCLEFRLHYDDTKVTPAYTQSDENDSSRFTVTPDSQPWEHMIRLYSEQSYYYIFALPEDGGVVAGAPSTSVITDSAPLTISIPFTVSSELFDGTVDFSVTDIVAYDADDIQLKTSHTAANAYWSAGSILPLGDISFSASSSKASNVTYTGDKDTDCFGVNINVNGTMGFASYKVTVEWDPEKLSLYADAEKSYPGYYFDDIYEEGLTFIALGANAINTNKINEGKFIMTDASSRNKSLTSGTIVVLDFYPVSAAATTADITVTVGVLSTEDDDMVPPEPETLTLSLVGTGHTHDYVRRVVEPTCTEDGYSIDECECGDSIIVAGSEVPALGHNNITVYSDRKSVTTCRRCNESSEQPITDLTFYASFANGQLVNYTGNADADSFGCNIGVTGDVEFAGYVLTVEWDASILALNTDNDKDGVYFTDYYSSGLTMLPASNSIVNKNNISTGKLIIADARATNYALTSGILAVLEFYPLVNTHTDALIKVTCTTAGSQNGVVTPASATTGCIEINKPVSGDPRLVSETPLVISSTNIIYGADAGKTVTYYKAQFDGAVTIKDKDGNILAASDVVGTNCTIVCGSQTYTVAVLGDVSCDGIITTMDAVLLLQAVAELYECTAAQNLAAELTGGENPEATTFDAVVLLQYIAEIITVFPVAA